MQLTMDSVPYSVKHRMHAASSGQAIRCFLFLFNQSSARCDDLEVLLTPAPKVGCDEDLEF
jgi:hypothetical protein